MTATSAAAHTSGEAVPQRIALVDLLDRVLATGVVVTGQVTLSIADVDLVEISLQALISSVRAGGPEPLQDVGGITETVHQAEEGGPS